MHRNVVGVALLAGCLAFAVGCSNSSTTTTTAGSAPVKLQEGNRDAGKAAGMRPPAADKP